jgi:hypothetical protein
MRLDRLRWPEWLIATGGVLLLVAMLALPWYGDGVRSWNGWHGVTSWRWVLLLTVVLALLAAATQLTRRSPAFPVTLTLFAGMAGAASIVVLIFRVLADPPGGSRKVGGFIALLGAVSIAYGAWQSRRSDSVPDRDAPHDIPVVQSVPTSGVGPGAAADS